MTLGASGYYPTWKLRAILNCMVNVDVRLCSTSQNNGFKVSLPSKIYYNPYLWVLAQLNIVFGICCIFLQPRSNGLGNSSLQNMNVPILKLICDYMLVLIFALQYHFYKPIYLWLRTFSLISFYFFLNKAN